MPEEITPVVQPQSDEGTPSGGAAPAPSKFDTLLQKKGFKSNDDLAGSYESIEQEHSRKSTVIDKARKQLESAGYTLRDDGSIEQVQPAGGGYVPPGGGYQQPQGQPAETVYDPYTGNPITDPIALQLIRLPPGQREAVIFNAMQDHREKQQSLAYQADTEILSKPEAKGFEDDVRKAMMQKPLAVRSDKAAWEQELYITIGKRHPQLMQQAAAQGVESFINKENIQAVPSSGGADTSGVKLDPTQEQQYRFYQQSRPGLFKDRKHFQQATSPNYGR